MIVSIDEHSGFCFGVTSAIHKAEEELNRGSLFCLGDIVHNGQEVARLEQKGLQTIDYERLRELRGGRVLLRAHGEPPSTYAIARNNEIEIIDATCPVVKKLQERIHRTYCAHSDAQIVIFGKIGHAEVIGLQGQTNNTALIIEKEADLAQIDYSRDIFLFAQTTKSIEEFQHLVAVIERTLSQMDNPPVFTYYDTICRNVASRVEELRQFAAAQDVVIFVGGQKSSNAKVLFEQCKKANPNTFFVTSVGELPIGDSTLFHSSARVGICGATSTPLWLMEQVREEVMRIEIKG